jgi:protein TonB
MKTGLFFGIVCAAVLHLGVLLLGGVLLPQHGKDLTTLQEVELLAEEELEPEEKKSEEEPEVREDMESEQEEAPDAEDVIRKMELAPENQTPELEAASLASIEAALSGQVGEGGDFAESLSFASGGRIGGTGKAGLDQGLDDAFSLSEIDQKPRAIFQASPVYPPALRSVEGVVTVIFIVTETGKVANPRVEKASRREFEKPAVDAIKQWKFEPAIKEGKRVACKMRAPIRFVPRSKS